MANPEHLKKLKEGVEAWNAWREECRLVKGASSRAKLEGADLSLGNLNRANLIRADLTRADLTDADLNWAKLRVTNLNWAKLIGADLYRAKLNGANLKDANLSGAHLSHSSLIESELSNANLSGADLTGANLHNWTIKGIKCTHIIWNYKEIHYDNPNDFEKAFTNIESIVEILLSLPFSGLSHLIGRNLEQEINQKYGDGSAIFKGQTAVSDDATRFEFLVHPEQFSELNDKLSKLQSQLNNVLEDFRNKNEPQSPIEFRDEVGWKDLVSLDFFVLKPKEISRELTERHARLHPLLQSIISTIQLHIR